MQGYQKVDVLSFVFSVIMKVLGNGQRWEILECLDLKCCFLWDCRKMFVLLHGAFPLKGTKKFCFQLESCGFICMSMQIQQKSRKRKIRFFYTITNNIDLFFFLSLNKTRPTMILYGINNIRDLFGHKVLLYALSVFQM